MRTRHTCQNGLFKKRGLPSVHNVPHQGEHITNANEHRLKKALGYHQYTASPPMREQHKCQQGLFKKEIGPPSVHSVLPIRTQHKCQKRLFKKHGLPSVHSVPTNENTAELPKEVAEKGKWATISTQRARQWEHSIGAKRDCLKKAWATISAQRHHLIFLQHLFPQEHRRTDSAQSA